MTGSQPDPPLAGGDGASVEAPGGGGAPGLDTVRSVDNPGVGTSGVDEPGWGAYPGSGAGGGGGGGGGEAGYEYGAAGGGYAYTGPAG